MMKINGNALKCIVLFLLFLHSCILGIIIELARGVYVKNLKTDDPLPVICNFIMYDISSPGYFSKYPVYFEFFITIFLVYICLTLLFPSLRGNNIYLINFIYFIVSTILFNLILIVFLLAFNSMTIIETLSPKYEYTTLSILIHYIFILIFILLITLTMISIFLKKKNNRSETDPVLKRNCK